MHHPCNKWRGHKPAAHIRNLSGPEPLAHEENQNVDGTVQYRTLQSQTILFMNQRGLYPKCASKVRALLSDSHWSLPQPWPSWRKNTSYKHTIALWAVYRTLTRAAASSSLQQAAPWVISKKVLGSGRARSPSPPSGFSPVPSHSSGTGSSGWLKTLNCL